MLMLLAGLHSDDHNEGSCGNDFPSPKETLHNHRLAESMPDPRGLAYEATLRSNAFRSFMIVTLSVLMMGQRQLGR
jgi:hypothetical protein